MVEKHFHINPLKPRIVMVANANSGEEVEKEESMSWEDAAKVSLVLTIAQIFMVFLPKYMGNWGEVISNPAPFCFDLLVFAGQTFFANFIALTGLSWVSTSRLRG